MVVATGFFEFMSTEEQLSCHCPSCSANNQALHGTEPLSWLQLHCFCGIRM